MLVAVLTALGARGASVIAEGGGSGAFVRAYSAGAADAATAAAADGGGGGDGATAASLFGAHHILLNPVLAEVPETQSDALYEERLPLDREEA